MKTKRMQIKTKALKLNLINKMMKILNKKNLKTNVFFQNIT